jgi:hypothetical protein
MARKPAKKAVLNVTIDEHLDAEARLTAALANTTISSVVEQALAEQLKWERIRRDGLKAIDEYYQAGYPTEEEMAEAAAQVAEEERTDDGRGPEAEPAVPLHPDTRQALLPPAHPGARGSGRCVYGSGMPIAIHKRDAPLRRHELRLGRGRR